MQFIDLQKQYQNLKERIDRRIQIVLDHGKYVLGPEVGELEEKLSEYVGVKHSIGVANGTDALQLSLRALDVGPGDAVFTTTFTFIATAEAISLAGAHPVFVDIDPETYNINPAKLDEVIAKTIAEDKFKPRALIAVDLFGLPADYDALSTVAEKYGLSIIEDAAQGLGGSINGKLAGSFSIPSPVALAACVEQPRSLAVADSRCAERQHLKSRSPGFAPTRQGPRHSSARSSHASPS